MQKWLDEHQFLPERGRSKVEENHVRNFRLKELPLSPKHETCGVDFQTASLGAATLAIPLLSGTPDHESLYTLSALS